MLFSSGPRSRRLRAALAVAAGAAATGACLSGPAGDLAAASPFSRRAPSVVAFPGPGLQTASPRTTIVFRGAFPAELGRVRVVGSRTGLHEGRLVAARVGTGAIFRPAAPFAPGERVRVHTAQRVVGADSTTYRFTVAVPLPGASAPSDPLGPRLWGQRMSPAAAHSDVRACRPVAPVYRSRPDLHPVRDCVSRHAVNTARGYVFTTPNPTSDDQHGPTIYNNSGQVVWYHPLAYRRIYDLSVLTYRHRRLLAYHVRGPRNPSGYRRWTWIFENKHYHTVATVAGKNGFEADGHELQVRGRDAWIGDYVPVRDPDTGHRVYEYVVQEVDIPTGELLFEWHSLQYIPTRDSYKPEPSDPGIWDYLHGNAIEPLSDGGFLLSARNTSAVYRIARDGSVLWTMGGKADQFHLVSAHPQWQFCFQHDVREVGAHQLSVFDNGGRGPGCPQHQARVEQFSYDTANWTVQRTADYSSYYASSDGKGYTVTALGSARYLNNGDLMVSWGQTGHITEFTPEHRVNFDLTLAKHTYRADRWRWVGDPQDRPAVAGIRVGGEVDVYASWNGSTRVRQWRVLAGSSRSRLQRVSARANRTGFETRIAVATDARYVAVRAIDRHGNVLTDSRTVPVR